MAKLADAAHVLNRGAVIRLPLILALAAPLAWGQAQAKQTPPFPRSFFDRQTLVKSFSWEHTQRFMSSGFPVVAFTAKAMPQELVAPLVVLHFLRDRLYFQDCDDIEWEVDGHTLEPLGHDYKHHARISVTTETFRFAFSWADLEELSGAKRARVRLCQEHIPLVPIEQIALRKMLEALIQHSVDEHPESTEQRATK